MTVSIVASLNKTLALRVITYEDDEEQDGTLVALAIDMDLRGYGDSQAEAVEELEGLVDCQLQFAQQQNDLRMAFFPADKKYYDMFAEAQDSQEKEGAQWRQRLEHLGALDEEEGSS